MGGCQNYGPLLGPPKIRCRIILRTQKGTIILTTTHMYIHMYRVASILILRLRVGFLDGPHSQFYPDPESMQHIDPVGSCGVVLGHCFRYLGSPGISCRVGFKSSSCRMCSFERAGRP